MNGNSILEDIKGVKRMKGKTSIERIAIVVAALSALVAIAFGIAFGTSSYVRENFVSEVSEVADGLVLCEPVQSPTMRLNAEAVELDAAEMMSSESGGTRGGQEVTRRIVAEVKPANAVSKRIAWSVEFENPSSAWAKGKKAEDYVILKVSADTLTVDVTPKLAFSERIKLSASSFDKKHKAHVFLKYLDKPAAFHADLVSSDFPVVSYQCTDKVTRSFFKFHKNAEGKVRLPSNGGYKDRFVDMRNWNLYKNELVGMHTLEKVRINRQDQVTKLDSKVADWETDDMVKYNFNFKYCARQTDGSINIVAAMRSELVEQGSTTWTYWRLADPMINEDGVLFGWGEYWFRNKDFPEFTLKFRYLYYNGLAPVKSVSFPAFANASEILI